MPRALALLLVLAALASCGGQAWNTTVAETPAARHEMARFVRPGMTTETALVARWGYPVQKIREGGQVQYLYRDMRSPPPHAFPQWGDSTAWVLVTFQYGLATAVETSDGVACHATFVPRPPGYGWGNPGTHKLVGRCPLDGLWGGGALAPGVLMTPAGVPGVPRDVYTGGAKGALAPPTELPRGSFGG